MVLYQKAPFMHSDTTNNVLRNKMTSFPHKMLKTSSVIWKYIFWNVLVVVIYYIKGKPTLVEKNSETNSYAFFIDLANKMKLLSSKLQFKTISCGPHSKYFSTLYYTVSTLLKSISRYRNNYFGTVFDKFISKCGR